jgi:hypothetical protein
METIETLNQRLVDYYGLDSDTGRPMFRIVWANDEVEKQMVNHTSSGFQLLYPVLAEVKKYPYLKDLYVLERLVVVPDINQPEIPVSKLSYEPIWCYRDSSGNSLPPVWDATQFVVDTLYAALGKKSLKKYVEPDLNEEKEDRVKKIQDELFGNETEVGDALAYGSGVVVPSNYKKVE